MASGASTSELVDPLQSLFGVSLFPRTFGAATNAPKPTDPKDLDSVHHFMKSVTSNSPERLINEAKAIVDGGSELLKSKFPGFLESLGIDKNSVALEEKENLRERRPGLGCKRPRFSLKADTRPPPVSLESNLDIDQLKDPEELFSALEKAENAKREIQRQKGGIISDSDNYDQSKHARCRRPGILGRAVNYKHRYTSSFSENNINFISSQETVELHISGPPTQESVEEEADNDLEAQETIVAGLISGEGLNNNLVDLLSQDIKDIDEDGVQEKLNINPVNPGKLSLPGFHDVGRTDFMLFGEKLPKVRKSIGDIYNVGKRLSEAQLKLRNGGSPITTSGSPTPQKLPSGSISLLKKRSLQSNPQRDPFSPLNIDPLVPTNTSSGDNVERQPPKISILKDLILSGNLESQFDNESGSPTPSNVDLHPAIRRASDILDNCLQDKNLHGGSINLDVDPTESRTDFDEHGIGDGLIGSSACTNKTTDEGDFDPIIAQHRTTDKVPDSQEAEVQLNSHADDSTHICSVAGPYVHQSQQVEEMPLASAIPASPEVSMHQSQRVENLCSDQPLLDCQTNLAATEGDSVISPSVTTDMMTTRESEDKVQPKQKGRAKRAQGKKAKELSRRKSLAEGQSNPAAIEENSVIPPSVTADIEITKESEKLQAKPKGREKRPRGESRELKALSRRKSLAEAGTSFESGVRRSKRIRSRPLEYWKGERFLYGRVDESFKLIGLKYISPGKVDGKLKVKPFVSNEYKEILELAALH